MIKILEQKLKMREGTTILLISIQARMEELPNSYASQWKKIANEILWMYLRVSWILQISKKLWVMLRKQQQVVHRDLRAILDHQRL